MGKAAARLSAPRAALPAVGEDYWARRLRAAKTAKTRTAPVAAARESQTDREAVSPVLGVLAVGVTVVVSSEAAGWGVVAAESPVVCSGCAVSMV